MDRFGTRPEETEGRRSDWRTKPYLLPSVNNRELTDLKKK